MEMDHKIDILIKIQDIKEKGGVRLSKINANVKENTFTHKGRIKTTHDKEESYEILKNINYPKAGVRHINKDLRHDGCDEYDKTSRWKKRNKSMHSFHGGKYMDTSRNRREKNIPAGLILLPVEYPIKQQSKYIIHNMPTTPIF